MGGGGLLAADNHGQDRGSLPNLNKLPIKNPGHTDLDEQARREYRRRMARLDAEIGDLQASGDSDRAALSIAEREWLAGELAAATGAGGRPRNFASDEERARIAVGKAIRRALDRIAKADTGIGAHLRTTITTGLRCSYQP
jgi:hypothetical protein